MINWAELDPGRTERGIQLLLRRLYPGLRSLDGAGGDGGRDAQLVTPDGRTIFEIKSFGRLNSSRRQQVQASLVHAVASAPDMTRWVLVIPMNMTPARPGVASSEESWFDDTLAGLAPGVDLDWWGLDWLDSQLAGHNDIQRYIEGTNSQLLQRAKEFGMEQSVLANGESDLAARLNGLRQRVDEVSPHWTLDFFVKDGMQGSMLRAKTPDSPLLDPVTLTPTITFRKDDADSEELRLRFERTLDFGGRVELPAGYVTEFEVDASPATKLLIAERDPTTSEFTFLTETEHLDRPLRCSYQVRDAADRVLTQFPVYLRERTAGSKGVTLFGSDASHVAKFEVRLPFPTDVVGPGGTATMDGASLELNLPESFAGYDVDSLHPVLEVLAQAVAGNTMRFDLPGLGYIDWPMSETAFPGATSMLGLVADLRCVQTENGSLYRFPTAISDGDVRDLRQLVEQIEGESPEFEGGLSLNLRPEKLADFLQIWRSGPDPEVPGGFLIATTGLELTVGDLKIPYGPAAVWAARPKLVNRRELEAMVMLGAPASGRGVPAQFEPTDLPFRWVSRQQAVEYLESDVRPDGLDE